MWYLGGRKKLLLRLPTDPAREDQISAALRRAVLKVRGQEARRNEWISVAMWRIIDEIVSEHQDPAKGQKITRRLGRAIKASLTTDRRR